MRALGRVHTSLPGRRDLLGRCGHALGRLALAAVIAFASFPAASQPGNPAAAEAGEPLLLDFCVNGRCVGVAAVIVRGDETLIDREALAAGLDVTGLAVERIGERDFIAVSAITHGATMAIDREALRLDLTLRAEQLPGQRVDLRQRVAADAVPQPWSAFVNYAANVGEAGDDRSVFLDGAVGRGHAAFRSTALWTVAQGWQRGLSRFEVDQPQHLRRWTVGDQFAIARDPLGGGALLGGVGVERAFEQDPYLVTFPQPFYSGVLESPGTVEVYANGVLIGRREATAGPFSLEGLGVPPGRSDVQVVVRDPFGNRNVLSTARYYGSSVLLAPGLSDYALRVGSVRGGGFGGGYADEPALQAWYRRGLSDRLTLGGRVEADERFVNLGMDAAVRTGFGEFGLALAASDDDAAGRGDAWSASYSYGGRRASIALGARRFDAVYRNLGEADLFGFGGRLRADDYANLSWSPGERLSLQLNAGRQRREALPAERSAGVSAIWRVSTRMQLLCSLQRRQVEAWPANGEPASGDTSALVSLNVSFDRDSFSLSARRDDSGTGVGVDARRSRPVDVGWGYDLSLQRFDGFDSGFGQIEYQGRHGRYAAQVERFGDDTRGRLLASGALVGIGGRGYATPPLETGFALVRVPDVNGEALGGIPILRENLEVGRTDARGDLLMRELIPYYPNKIALDPSAVPLNYQVLTPQREVAVPRNAGALVRLQVQGLRAATGVVHLREGATTRPAGYGAMILRGDGKTYESVLGGGGRFYFEDLPPGEYAVEVESGGRRARCTLALPTQAEAGIAELGELTCPVGGEGR